VKKIRVYVGKGKEKEHSSWMVYLTENEVNHIITAMNNRGQRW
jgi:hypothetical protein